MANNRMFLRYKPTGQMIGLGKRMGQGWYMPSTEESMQKFFDHCEAYALHINYGELDDFELVFESDDGFIYTPDRSEFKWKNDD